VFSTRHLLNSQITEAPEKSSSFFPPLIGATSQRGLPCARRVDEVAGRPVHCVLATAGYHGLRSAPIAFLLCALCGRGGADVQIMHRSHIDVWHRACAEEYLAAPVPEPESQIERDV
jgi:hypothetical protein